MEVDPIISKNIRVRYPEHFRIGKNCVIDDFCYFSTQVVLEFNCHISPGCSSMGGKKVCLCMKDYVGVSAGVRFVCGSDDFVNDLSVVMPKEFMHVRDNHGIYGDILIDKYCIIGTNSVIMPINYLPEGVAIGALSYIPSKFEFKPWTVYAGIPIKEIKQRNKDSIMSQVEKAERLRYAHTQ
jgi:acetyltransferase-like isoleucine patch superfamily enzyme